MKEGLAAEAVVNLMCYLADETSVNRRGEFSEANHRAAWKRVDFLADLWLDDRKVHRQQNFLRAIFYFNLA